MPAEARGVRSPELKLQAVVSNLMGVLGTKLGSSGIATAISPAPKLFFLSQRPKEKVKEDSSVGKLLTMKI